MIVLGIPVDHNGRTWWHLGSTESIEELQTFARKIGLHPSWFQEQGSHPHYDVTGGMKARAISAGAKEVDSVEYIRTVFRGEKGV